MEIVRDAAIRRYVRLVIPIAAASTLAFVMMSSGLLFNVESSRIVNSSDWLGLFYRQSPNIFGMLRFFLFDVFFRYDLATSYGAFLWTMAYELAGSFMVFAVLALAGDSLKTRAVWYAALALVCHFQAQVLITFLCGMVSAEFALSAALGRFRAGRWANGLGTGLLAAVFAGSVLLRTHYTTELRAGLALLTLWAVVISRWLRTLLETRLSRWLGRISFPLYLVHSLVICGPSSFLIIELTRRGWSHVSIVAAVVPFTLVAALGAAALFSPVERWAIQASRWFSGLILPPRSAAAP